ncbi:MAG TPA: M48 family metalloprotease [bacterium]|nr:M48 family metalloprotease [bacterium]
MKHLILFSCLAVMFITTGCATNPVTGRRQLAIISEASEIETGRAAFPQYTQAFQGEFQDDTLQGYVTTVGKKLAANSHRPNLEYEFRVVNTSDVNAFALPGGKIMITRALLEKFDNEAQMAGVLGHEVGHVAAMHYISDASQQLLINLVIAAGAIYMEHKGYKYADYATLGAYVGAMMYLAHYSREQERQADQLGVEYMTKNGYDPRAYVSVMELFLKLQEGEPSIVERLFATHPLTTERIATCTTQATSMLAQYNTNPAAPLRLAQAEYGGATRRLMAVAPAYALMDEGDKLQEDGNYNAAIAKYTEGIRQAPDQPLIYLSRAQAYMEQDELGQAGRDIAAARKYYPDLFYTRYFAGIHSFKSRSWQRSLTEFNAAEKLLAGVTDVQFYLGRCEEELGHRSAAAEHFTKFLEDEPEGDNVTYCKTRLRDWGYTVPGEAAAPAGSTTNSNRSNTTNSSGNSQRREDDDYWRNRVGH